MLQFDRDAVRAPHLVVVEGGRPDVDPPRGVTDHVVRSLRRPPVVLVLLATLVAVIVDLVDSVPAWSHWAAAGSGLVLLTHTVVARRRR